MRIVYDNVRLETNNLLKAICRDSESWRDWRYLCLELSSFSLGECIHHEKSIIKKLIDTYLQDKRGTAFFDDVRVHILCKNIPCELMKSLSIQVMESGKSIQLKCLVYDIADNPKQIVELLENDADEPKSTLINRCSYIIGNETELISKVLLVDDDPVTGWIVTSALQNYCEVVVADNIDKAMSMYDLFDPDLVLLDINLCGYDGCRVLQDIRRNDQTAYIVMFSGSDTVENIVKTINQGARGFIAKPFKPDLIMYHIYRALSESRQGV
jgi:CheY-like chemotaxis protein